MKGTMGGKRNNCLNYGGDPDHHADCRIRNPAITGIQQIMRIFDEILRIAWQRRKEQLINFWGDMDHHTDFPNWESGQYRGELPWRRRSALSQYACFVFICGLWRKQNKHCAKKPVTTLLTYTWKCTVLHCNHLGNTWKPLVLMT